MQNVQILLAQWRATYDQLNRANSCMRLAVEALDLEQIEHWTKEVERHTRESNEALGKVNRVLGSMKKP